MYEEEKQYIQIVESRFNPDLFGSLTKTLKQHCITSNIKAAREEKDW
jgi:hypothetical protein